MTFFTKPRPVSNDSISHVINLLYIQLTSIADNYYQYHLFAIASIGSIIEQC